jgi:hypothetical protein
MKCRRDSESWLHGSTRQHGSKMLDGDDPLRRRFCRSFGGLLRWRHDNLLRQNHSGWPGSERHRRSIAWADRQAAANPAVMSVSVTFWTINKP